MEITDLRVKLSNRNGDRLKAYCSITFDGEFVVRDVRVVEGTNGLFVAMPSRKASHPCGRCSYKNPVSSKFCSQCGAKLPGEEPIMAAGSRVRLHRDVAHPITPAFRQKIQDAVIEAYRNECELAKSPEYEPEEWDEEEHPAEEESEGPVAVPPTRMRRPVAPVDEEYEEAPAAPEPQQRKLSEYDSLIAEMRRRSGVTPATAQPVSKRPAAAPQGNRGGAPRSQDRDFGQRGGRPSGPGPRTDSRGDRREGSRPQARPMSRPPERREERPVYTPRPVESPAFGTFEEPEEIVETVEPSATDRTVDEKPQRSDRRPEPARPMEPKRPAPPLDDNATPFGAGIL